MGGTEPLGRLTPRRPLGLVLAGGGALGAWQAGFLVELAKSGISYDRIFGFSIGALNGAALWQGRLDLLAGLWERISLMRSLRFSPRLNPPSFLSHAPIREMIAQAGLNDASARATARCPFTVVSLDSEEARPIYARFCPPGRGEWGENLMEHLVASCSIPRAFPPVRLEAEGRLRTLIDGGVPGIEPLSFAELSDCADVLVLEMVRPEEMGRKRPWPLSLDQSSRETLRRGVSFGIAGLKRRSDGTRVFRVCPSRLLDFTIFGFSPRNCGPAFRLGEDDAGRFLEDSAHFLA